MLLSIPLTNNLRSVNIILNRTSRKRKRFFITKARKYENTRKIIKFRIFVINFNFLTEKIQIYNWGTNIYKQTGHIMESIDEYYCNYTC